MRKARLSLSLLGLNPNRPLSEHESGSISRFASVMLPGSGGEFRGSRKRAWARQPARDLLATFEFALSAIELTGDR